jgi:DNA-binding response OmpR family regulator
MSTPSAPAPGVDVLIVEDDALTREGLRLLLEQHGYACAEAGDGRAALALARQRPPGCVILDLGLPELDGFAVAHRLRSEPRTRDVPIHCLTGRTDAACRKEAERIGCNAYLAKPVNAEVLLRLVRRRPRPGTVRRVTGLTLAEAQELLDWLENHGCTDPQLDFQEETGFAVCWVCPPGLTSPGGGTRQGASIPAPSEAGGAGHGPPRSTD